MTEREYAREAPFSPAGILGDLSNSLRRRELPREYEPRAEEDRAAIYLNQKEFDPYAMTDEVLGAVIRDHRAAFPLATLSCLFAVFMYPTLTAGDESPIAALAEQLDKRWSATIRENRRVNRSEAPREIAVMAWRLQSILESNLVRLYASIAGHQFWFMRAFWLNWWNRDAMSGPASYGKRLRWFAAAFILAITCETYNITHALYTGEGETTPGMPQVAVDWLLGRTDNPDGFIAAQARIHSRFSSPDARDLLRELKDTWATIRQSDAHVARSWKSTAHCVISKYRFAAKGPFTLTHLVRWRLFHVTDDRETSPALSRTKASIRSDAVERRRGLAQTWEAVLNCRDWLQLHLLRGSCISVTYHLLTRQPDA